MTSDQLSSMKELLTCNLCSKFYNDPRLLPCFHTYCFQCINRILMTNKNSFPCLHCDDQIEITQNDIENLPHNQIVEDMIQLYTLIENPTMCSDCRTSRAEHMCERCENDYCSTCDKTIHDRPSFKNHRRISIDKKGSRIGLCEEHSDEKLKYWCQPCHKSVCSECLLNEHKDHSYHLINTASKELETMLEADFERIKSSLNDKITEADLSLNTIANKSELNKRTVKETMNHLREIIDEHEKQILEDIENVQKEESQSIEEYKLNLEKQFKYSNIQKEFLNLILFLNDQIRLLKNKQIFLDYINQTNQFLNHLQKPNETDYHLTGLQLLQNIQELITQCATLTQTQKSIVQIYKEEKPQIDKLIAQYQTSQDVDLNKQSLNDQNIFMINQLLKECNNMVTLNLSNNQIGSNGIGEIVNILQDSQLLTILDLSNNKIGDDGVKYLANMLKTNTSLTTLYLYDNGITDRGIFYLTEAIQDNHTLTILDLQSNEITPIGAQYLADLLRKNNTLTTLYLSNNRIGSQGALYLADALQENKTLTMFILSDNQIDYEAKRRVIEILKTNSRLAVHW